MLTIGNVKLKDPVILAPLAGISDLPFRLINRMHGLGLAYVEMTSDKAVIYRNQKTGRMLQSVEGDRPLGMQLVGRDETLLLKALEMILSEHGPDLVDFNAACPVRKVVYQGEGAAMLKEPGYLGGILKSLVRHCPVPLTVKIRAGWDRQRVNSSEIAMIAEDAGVSGIYIHGRTRTQGYSGAVDYNAIAAAKRAVKIPVIGSGDIFSAVLAKKMIDETGADGVAVARGAFGNPWIFKEIAEFLETGRVLPRPGMAEIAETAKRHLAMLSEHYGEAHGVRVFRKFFIYYTRGMHGAKPLRVLAVRAATIDEMNALIDKMALECRIGSSGPGGTVIDSNDMEHILDID